MRNWPTPFILATTALAAIAPALCSAEVSIPLSDAANLDPFGSTLRKAINAYEQAERAELPQAWTRLRLVEGETRQLNTDNLIKLLPPEGVDTAIMATSPEGPVTELFQPGVERRVADLIVILVDARGSEAEVLVRGAYYAPFLRDAEADGGTSVRIVGVEAPPALEVEAPRRAMEAFAEVVVAELKQGRTAEQAAEAAWMLYPPQSRLTESSAASMAAGAGSSPREVRPVAADYTAAFVTLRVVRGEDASLRALASQWSVSSDGSPTEGVSASHGAGGTTVGVGSPGDAFNARLRALQRDSQVSVESETFARVELGDRVRFSFNGPNGMAAAYLRARPVGNRVELTIDQTSGDWSFLGGVSTRVTMRDGQTVTLAKSTYSRTSTSSSGPPIIGGIPYVGGLAGNSSSSRQNSSYALFATMELQ